MENNQLPADVQEIWKPIPGYEDRYEVSDFGGVRSLPKKNRSVPLVMKPSLSGFGYLSVCISKPGDGKKKGSRVYVHKLVAIAFIPNPKKLKEVNHINANKLDNKLSNLEWVSPKENVRHSHLSGNSQYHHKITDYQVQLIRYNPDNKTTKELSEEFGISMRYVRDIRNGIRRKIDVYKELRTIEAKTQILTDALEKILKQHDYYSVIELAANALQQWKARKEVGG